MTEEKTQTEGFAKLPRADVFDNEHIVSGSIMNAGQRFHVYEKTEYPEQGGIYVYYKGMPFPKKGFPFPEAIWHNNMAKRIFVSMAKTFAQKSMALPVVGFIVLPWKYKLQNIQRMAESFNEICSWILESYYLKADRYSNPCRSLRKLSENFLIGLGVEKITAEVFAKNLATLIEYDDAYRYRLQDIFSETGRLSLRENPVQETKRLVDILLKREKTHAEKSFTALGRIASYALYHPKIRTALNGALSISKFSLKDWNMLTMDNADRYHVLLRNDYDFTGRTFDERVEIYKGLHVTAFSDVKDISTAASTCCQEKIDGNICSKCKKECNIVFTFPPQIEIVPETKP